MQLAVFVNLTIATLCAAQLARGADTKAECLAAADQGQSLRDDGSYRRAHEAFATCARDACPRVVANACSNWLRQLDEATPTIVLAAKDAAGNDVANVRVSIDDAPLAGALDGKPQEVDPGEHALRFEHEGAAPIETRVVIRAGEKNRIVGVTFPAESVSADPSTAANPLASPQAPPGDVPIGSPQIRNATVLTLALVAAAAAGGGAYFLAQSSDQAKTASRLRTGLMSSSACTDDPTSASCSSLSDAVDAQHRDAALGVTLLAGAGAFAAGAFVAWLAWPRQQPGAVGAWVAPSVGPTGASIRAGVRF
jgi:hypothetical protein